jgi:flagella basal body P-ring formation protein FlgA
MMNLIRFALVGCVMSGLMAAALPAAAATQHLVVGAQIATAGEREARQFVHDSDHGIVALTVPDQQIPAGKVTLFADKARSFGDTYINVPVTIYVDGKAIRQIFAGYRIAHFTMVPVAVHDLSVGEILADTDLTVARMPDDGLQIPNRSALIGRSMSSPVLKGHMPALWQTNAVMVVKYGEPVVLVVQDGDVALSEDVIARSSGAVGDSISVYDAQGERTFNVVVTGPGKVELQLPEVGNS